MLVTGGLAIALLGLAPVPASATADAGLQRLAGDNRYLTAVNVSRDAWGNQEAQAVVLARGDVFPDALAGTPLAVAKSAPLLLTPPTSLNSATANEIKRALPSGRNVFLLGGPAALSDAVASAITNLGYRPVRLAGADRYATATVISRQIASPTTIFEATGLSFPSALVAGVAAAKVRGVVVLTADRQMPASTKTYLDQNAGKPRVAVGPEATGADPSAQSISGADKYDTARKLAETYFPDPTVIAVASGTVFADALSGGAHIGKLGGPLLLSEPTSVPMPVRTLLADHVPTISSAYLYGGPAALNVHVEDVVQNTVRGATFFGDGTFRIGEDLPAGTYRTRRPSEGFCYWERKSGFSGSSEEIIANEIGDEHQVVTIESSDAGFKSDDCGTWTSDLSALTESPTAPFQDGTWIVGVDIAPGTWTAPGGDECYWERLSNFTGEFDALLANDFGPTNPIVTVESGDAGFRTSNCGQWKQSQ